MRNAVQLCLAANNILHMREGNRTFLGYRSCVKMADHFASRGLKLGYSKTQERIKGTEKASSVYTLFNR